ncbi:MAG: DUF512 domain-containing protein [Fastidiosipilaceae bacterium]|jgi:putative radical SAM enzyme (TIGR03279 family)
MRQSKPKSNRGQLITAVEPGSIADELGIRPGDRLARLNDQPVRDVFAYRLQILEENLLLEIETEEGERLIFEIEKDEDELLGMEFEDGLMDESRHCHNKCVFCFIDQLPQGMRDSLYFKDDDLRLSFLTGNYVTLTNIDDEELNRLIDYRLSPMNVSVHTTNPELRFKMLGNPRSVKIMEQLDRIGRSGIELNCQIVLCPDVNDGMELERTLEDLETLGDSLLSVAVVPVGITKYRTENRLYPLNSFNQLSAEAVLDQVERWQRRFLKTAGRRIFFAADEFYLRARRPVPPYKDYEGFPQLENGVGMLALLTQEIESGLHDRQSPAWDSSEAGRRDDSEPRLLCGDLPGAVDAVHILTGTDAAPWLERYARKMSELYPFQIQVHAVRNCFFGEKITVAGLLTGEDLFQAIERLTCQKSQSVVLIPDCTLRADEDVFLDGVTPTQLSERTDCCVLVGRESGTGLLRALDLVAERATAFK